MSLQLKIAFCLNIRIKSKIIILISRFSSSDFDAVLLSIRIHCKCTVIRYRGLIYEDYAENISKIRVFINGNGDCRSVDLYLFDYARYDLVVSLIENERVTCLEVLQSFTRVLDDIHEALLICCRNDILIPISFKTLSILIQNGIVRMYVFVISVEIHDFFLIIVVHGLFHDVPDLFCIHPVDVLLADRLMCIRIQHVSC